MKIVFSAALFALCLIWAETAGAVAPPAPKHPFPVLIYSRQASDAIVFRGTVKAFARSTALFTKDAIYPLIGGDFDMSIGRKVNVIGKVVLEDDIQKIAVARVQFDRKP